MILQAYILFAGCYVRYSGIIGFISGSPFKMDVVVLLSLYCSVLSFSMSLTSRKKIAQYNDSLNWKLVVFLFLMVCFLYNNYFYILLSSFCRSSIEYFYWLTW